MSSSTLTLALGKAKETQKRKPKILFINPPRLAVETFESSANHST
jgi:hypothetical protein